MVDNLSFHDHVNYVEKICLSCELAINSPSENLLIAFKKHDLQVYDPSILDKDINFDVHMDVMQKAPIYRHFKDTGCHYSKAMWAIEQG